MSSTTKTIRAYIHQPQPSQPESIRFWHDTELKNIQTTLNDIISAIKQLQVFTGV